MKKFLFLLIMCICFTSCTKLSDGKVAEIDNETIMSELVDEVIADLKYKLKDPSSLKVRDFSLIVELANKDVADKCTENWCEIQKRREKYIELQENGVDITDLQKYLVYNSPFVNTNARYIFFQVTFYGKNGFGAYSSDEQYYVAEVVETSRNKNGTHKYFVDLHDAVFWKGLSELSDETDYTYNSGLSFIKMNSLIPTEYKF